MTDPTPSNPWRDFEREVASIFRALGATVEHDVALAGNQIDVIAREKTASGRSVATIIECKAYRRPVGIEVVNALSSLFHLLKGRGEADAAILVSQAGFTRAARDAARAHGVELLEIADLRQRAEGALMRSRLRLLNFRRRMRSRQAHQDLHGSLSLCLSVESLTTSTCSESGMLLKDSATWSTRR